ncbi:hypothetical protein ES703_96624 [subsurface metagenome]
MTDTNPPTDHGHSRIFGNEFYQPGTTAGNNEVNNVTHFKQVAYQSPIGILNKLHGAVRDTGSGYCPLNHLSQGTIRVNCLLTSPQNNGITRLKTQGRDVYGNVGAAFIDSTDYPQGHPLSTEQ